MKQNLQKISALAAEIANEPDNPDHKQAFMSAVSRQRFRKYNPDFKLFFQTCLEDRTLDHNAMMRPWFSLLKTMPEFKKIYKLRKKKSYEEFRAAFAALPHHEALFDAYFLLGLKSYVIPDAEFERFLTWFRRFILEILDVENVDPENKAFEPVIAALAHYCFYTEYIFDLSAEEKAKVALLRDRLEDGTRTDAFAVFLFGCYAPLYSLKNSLSLAGVLKETPDYAELAKEQITDFHEEQKLKREIKELKPVRDNVSSLVQAQYEEFPYPRWKATQHVRNLKTLEDVVTSLTGEGSDQESMDILIAGCGTGRQAVQCALAFPGAKITAVDLSLTSLAYGKRKAKEHGIKNMEFLQADILELGDLGKAFDFIMCTGVLHHMEDPERGWSVLTGILKPEGVMFIALYSEIARAYIARTREVIMSKGYSNTAEDIRKFRTDCFRLLKRKDLKQVLRSHDFYVLSECRDMLFHVQEHRYELPQISGMLERLKLKIVRFEPPQLLVPVYQKRFPDDPSGTNLDNWNKLERKRPDTFVSMYRFWCKRTDL